MALSRMKLHNYDSGACLVAIIDSFSGKVNGHVLVQLAMALNVFIIFCSFI